VLKHPGRRYGFSADTRTSPRSAKATTCASGGTFSGAWRRQATRPGTCACTSRTRGCSFPGTTSWTPSRRTSRRGSVAPTRSASSSRAWTRPPPTRSPAPCPHTAPPSGTMSGGSRS
jgi:hypothetical protein